MTDVTMARKAGILLHPTSLPGAFGIGDLGEDAYRFVDFLKETEQSLWQVLPLGPTGHGNSPYMSFSAFGGNPLLISPLRLAEAGLLTPSEVSNPPSLPGDRVDYGRVMALKRPLLERAFQRFTQRSAGGVRDDFYGFCEQNCFWLDDYALFMALKEAHAHRVWSTWEPGAARYEPGALVSWRRELAQPIQYHKFLQYTFFRQWADLRRYCHARGIQLIGDIPIYVAHDSAEVWANRARFVLDQDGQPVAVAGVPPDYFSATGQRWGNPLYDWSVMAETGYQWWIDRFRANFSLVDIVRLDHFRGFEAYWEVPASEPTAVNGTWVKGPGAALFEAVDAELSRLGIAFDAIAEDLGLITPEVDHLREQLDLPGMRILQMAFGDDPKAADYRPHNHVGRCVVYTATHDHNTMLGWFQAQPGSHTTQTREQVQRERAYALEYLDTAGEEIHWDFIRLALGSVASMAIYPLQDVLGLGAEARMNRPGTTRGNWEWRFNWRSVDQTVRDCLSSLTRIYERTPRSEREA
jgi:4-alpha-glucanotransferase